MPKPKQPTFPAPNDFEDLAQDVFELCELVAAYTKAAADTASGDRIEVAQRALGRILRDAATANVQLAGALRLARSKEELRQAFDNAERNPPNRSAEPSK